MGEATSSNEYRKTIVALFTIVSLMTVAVCGCTSKPQNEQQKETLLTITFGDDSYNYSMDDLLILQSSSGQGSFINSKGKITGPNNFTGVAITAILNDAIPDLPSNYTIQAIASDNYTVNYTMDELNGHITVFNRTGQENGTGNLTMIIAYLQNGEYLNKTTNGPLRIAFIDTEPSITRAGLWLNSVVKIKVISKEIGMF